MFYRHIFYMIFVVAKQVGCRKINSLRCANGMCLPSSVTCDGVDYCRDGSTVKLTCCKLFFYYTITAACTVFSRYWQRTFVCSSSLVLHVQRTKYFQLCVYCVSMSNFFPIMLSMHVTVHNETVIYTVSQKLCQPILWSASVKYKPISIKKIGTHVLG